VGGPRSTAAGDGGVRTPKLGCPTLFPGRISPSGGGGGKDQALPLPAPNKPGHVDPVSQPGRPLPCPGFWGRRSTFSPENPSWATPWGGLACPGMSGETRFVAFQRHAGMKPDGAYKQVRCWRHPGTPNWGLWSSLPHPGTLQPQTGELHSSLLRPGSLKSQTEVLHRAPALTQSPTTPNWGTLCLLFPPRPCTLWGLLAIWAGGHFSLGTLGILGWVLATNQPPPWFGVPPPNCLPPHHSWTHWRTVGRSPPACHRR